MAHEIHFLISHQELIQQCAFCVCVSMHSWSDNYNRLQPQMDYIQSDEYELVSLCRLNNFESNQALSSALKHQKVLALSLSRFADSISVRCAQLCCTERFIRYNMAMCHGKGGIFCCCYSYFMYVYIPCVSSKSIWMKTPACPRKHAQQLLKMWDNIMKYPKIRTLHEKKNRRRNDAIRGWKNCTYLYLAHPAD